MISRDIYRKHNYYVLKAQYLEPAVYMYSKLNIYKYSYINSTALCADIGRLCAGNVFKEEANYTYDV